MPESGIARTATLVGRLLPRRVRDLMFDPYRNEIWFTCVTEGRSQRSRCRFLIQMAGGFGLALVYSIPDYVRGPSQATRVLGVPVVLVAVAALGLAVLLPDCAVQGIALALTR